MTRPTVEPERSQVIAPVTTSLFFGGGSLLAFVVPPLLVGVFAGSSPAPGLLVALALVELCLSWGLIWFWLKRRGMSWSSLGTDITRWRSDLGLALVTFVPRVLLEMLVLIPMAGGVDNPGVQEVLDFASAGWFALGATILLGVVGGGLAEEMYFRGFMLGSMPGMYRSSTTALKLLSVLSVVLFAGLHLPGSFPDFISIFLAGLTYVGLYLFTRRLLTVVFAHALWNLGITITVVAVYV